MVMDPRSAEEQLSMFDVRLLEAVRSDDSDKVLLLLGSGADIHEPDPANNDTALHIATREGHKQIIARLLRAGADPDKVNTAGETPRYLATLNGSAYEMLFHMADRIRDKAKKRQAKQGQSDPYGNEDNRPSEDPALGGLNAPTWRAPRRAF